MPLVTRTAKGSPLTTAEMDANLTFLNARTRPYPTVAAMKADADLAVGETAQTLGYYAAGDGGGATYEIVSANTVLGYDEPNIQAANFFDSGMRGNFKSPYWLNLGMKAYGSGTVENTTALAAPDGTFTAEFLQESTATSSHGFRTNYVPYTGGGTTGPQEWFCYFAKSTAPSSRRYCMMSLVTGVTAGQYPWEDINNRAAAVVDLFSGTVTKQQYGTNHGPQARTVVTSVGSNWWLIRMLIDPVNPSNPSVAGSNLFYVGAANTSTPAFTQDNVDVTSYTGDGASGIYVWDWGLRPTLVLGIYLTNGLQAKPILGSSVRLAQFGATAQSGSDALYKALAYFGASVPGSIIVDAPSTVSSTWTIPSNVTLRFEGHGSLAGITNMTVNSQILADNRAILPKAASVTFGPQQRSVPSTWFGL